MDNLLLKRIRKMIYLLSHFAKNFFLWLGAAPEFFRNGGKTEVRISEIRYDKILSNKRVLITGGSSGIGLAIAKKLIEVGATVIITGRSSDKLRSAEEEIDSPNLSTIVWDIGEIDMLRERLNEAINQFDGDFDVLINNAGILSKNVFPFVQNEDWDNVYRINSKGLFFLTQEVYKFWKKSSKKTYPRKILNISSQGGFVGATYPYRMTKWDIAGLTQGLGKLLAKDQIIVNGIAPGIVVTEMQKNYLAQGENAFCDLNPLGRVSYPKEIAELAVFLLSDASNFIVGQTIVCDGGFSIN